MGSSEVGRVIGRYVLYDAIASGGMATIHLGRLVGQVGFERVVAIKRLHPHLAKDPDFVTMFFDEARVAAGISHPNVVSTVDVVAADGELFLVMEYIEGDSLSHLIRDTRRAGKFLDHTIVSAVMAGALYGLHSAHTTTDARGQPLHMIHRDVSPQNILIGIDGVARMVDFGVAKAARRIQVTEAGRLKGKFSYMAPEMVRHDSVDHRADVFSAGICLWEALTGKFLFHADQPGRVIGKLLEMPVPPPTSIVPSIPPALDAIVARALERDPDKRYQSARELAIALEDAVPPAIPRKVGAWVESYAGAAIKKRAARLAELASDVAPAGPVNAAQLHTELGAGTPASGATPPPVSPPRPAPPAAPIAAPAVAPPAAPPAFVAPAAPPAFVAPAAAPEPPPPVVAAPMVTPAPVITPAPMITPAPASAPAPMLTPAPVSAPAPEPGDDDQPTQLSDSGLTSTPGQQPYSEEAAPTRVRVATSGQVVAPESGSPPEASSPFAAAVPAPSPPEASSPHAAAPPEASSPFAAAPPEASSPFAAAPPEASSPFAAAPPEAGSPQAVPSPFAVPEGASPPDTSAQAAGFGAGPSSGPWEATPATGGGFDVVRADLHTPISQVSVGSYAGPPRRSVFPISPAGRMAAAAGAAVLILVVGIVVLVSASYSPDSESPAAEGVSADPGEAQRSAAQPTAAAAPTASHPIEPAPPAEPVESAEPEQKAPKPEKKEPEPEVSAKKPPTKPPAPVAPPPTAKPPVFKGFNCNPPYTVDANGIKKFKRECM